MRLSITWTIQRKNEINFLLFRLTTLNDIIFIIKMSIPTIKPYSNDKYTCNQSEYKMVSELPTRALIVAPSNSGKSVLLQNIILDIYRGCFERVYIFSPSIHIDAVWKPVLDYCTHTLKQHETEREHFYFDTFDQTEFKAIITQQAKIVKHMKDRKMKKIYNIAIIIDDFLDNQKFLRRTPDLTSRPSLVFRSTKGGSQVIRMNINDMYLFKLRNYADLEAFLEEFAALADKKTVEKIYRMATDEPYGFLYVKLGSTSINDKF